MRVGAVHGLRKDTLVLATSTNGILSGGKRQRVGVVLQERDHPQHLPGPRIANRIETKYGMDGKQYCCLSLNLPCLEPSMIEVAWLRVGATHAQLR